MRNVKEYEVLDHGVDHSQYFQGCGVSFTKFEDCHTGIGSTPREALEYALEMAAESGWNVDGIVNDLSDTSDLDDDQPEDSELFHFVSIRLR